MSSLKLCMASGYPLKRTRAGLSVCQRTHSPKGCA